MEKTLHESCTRGHSAFLLVLKTEKNTFGFCLWWEMMSLISRLALFFIYFYFFYLIQLNMELQGRDKTIRNWWSTSCFSDKNSHSSLLISVLGRCSTSHIKDIWPTKVMSGCNDSLKNYFSTTFNDFSISNEVMRFIKDPFFVNVEENFAYKEKLVPKLDEFFTAGTHWHSVIIILTTVIPAGRS